MLSFFGINLAAAVEGGGKSLAISASKHRLVEAVRPKALPYVKAELIRLICELSVNDDDLRYVASVVPALSDVCDEWIYATNSYKQSLEQARSIVQELQLAQKEKAEKAASSKQSEEISLSDLGEDKSLSADEASVLLLKEIGEGGNAEILAKEGDSHLRLQQALTELAIWENFHILVESGGRNSQAYATIVETSDLLDETEKYVATPAKFDNNNRLMVSTEAPEYGAIGEEFELSILLAPDSVSIMGRSNFFDTFSVEHFWEVSLLIGRHMHVCISSWDADIMMRAYLSGRTASKGFSISQGSMLANINKRACQCASVFLIEERIDTILETSSVTTSQSELVENRYGGFVRVYYGLVPASVSDSETSYTQYNWGEASNDSGSSAPKAEVFSGRFRSLTLAETVFPLDFQNTVNVEPGTHSHKDASILQKFIEYGYIALLQEDN